MIDLLFEGFRRVTESALETQRDLLKHWSQQWVGIPLGTVSRSTEWYRSLQRRWFELTITTLHKNRAALDTAYRSGIDLLEQFFEAAEARSAGDAFKLVEDFWRKLFGSWKAQSETRFRDLQQWSAMSFEMVNSGRNGHANGKGQSA